MLILISRHAGTFFDGVVTAHLLFETRAGGDGFGVRRCQGRGDQHDLHVGVVIRLIRIFRLHEGDTLGSSGYCPRTWSQDKKTNKKKERQRRFL